MASLKTEFAAIKKELKLHAVILGGMLGVMWLMLLINTVAFQGGLVRYGIHPRSVSGLTGLVTWPFLHGGFGHLASNSIPFLVLGWLVMSRSVGRFFAVTLVGAIVGGLGVWAIGASNSVHVGASGLIFAYFGYLLMAGWFERSFGSILMSVIVFFAYGGMIFGVFPGQAGISWEGHLFGFAAGALVARAMKSRDAKKLPNKPTKKLVSA